MFMSGSRAGGVWRLVATQLVAGCSGDDGGIELTPPSLSGVNATVTAALRSQPTGPAQIIRLEAADSARPVVLDGEDRSLDLQVVVLYYDRTLDLLVSRLSWVPR